MAQTILDILEKHGYLQAGDKDKVLKDVRRGKKRAEEILLEKNLVNEETLFKIKAEALRLLVWRLDEGKSIALEVLQYVPPGISERYRMVALEVAENQVTVGMVYPEDIDAQEALKFLASRTGFTPKVVLINFSDFEKVMGQYRSLKTEVSKALESLEEEAGKEVKFSLPEIAPVAPSVVGEEAPIIKTVSVIVRHAVEGRASDIHIEPLEKETRVRFRVDGVLHSSLILPKDLHSQIVSRVKILSNLKLDETRVPQDGRFRMTFEDKNIDFRVSLFPTSQGEKVVMRILDPSIGVRKLENLGWQGINLEKIQRGISKPFGMTLITGPTGSGKSTTLASMMGILNRESINMVTLEDPIEYYLEGVSQSQVRPELGYSFASGLRSILRQDPDAIMVGEVRDPETAELVIHASLTGHIVLSTLHTNNAIGVVPRLIDMGVDHYLIPSTLNVAAAQRLVRRLCSHCKKRVKPSPPKLKIIEEVLAEIPDGEKKKFNIKPPYSIYEGEGCPKCGGKGTTGRVAICEVMEMTKEFEKIILKKPSESEIEEEGKRQKMMSLKMDAMIKVLQGVLAFDEAMRVVELREEGAPQEMRVGK